MRRYFTCIDGVVEGLVRLTGVVPKPDADWNGEAPDPSSSLAPYRLYNIGNHSSVELMYLIEVLENCLGRKAVRNFLPMQPGDVPATCGDILDLEKAVGFAPRTPIETGVERFVRRYREYYRCDGIARPGRTGFATLGNQIRCPGN